MRRTLLAAALAASSICAGASEWTYSTSIDSFDNVEKKIAVLRGSGNGHNVLQVANHSNGVRFVTVSASDIDCFPRCVIRVKFDDDAPEDFEGTGHRIVSAAVSIHNYDRFMGRLSKAKQVVFRLPYHRYGTDVVFANAAGFDANGWEAARRRQAIMKRCKENAVNEDYATCMTRLSSQE